MIACLLFRREESPNTKKRQLLTEAESNKSIKVLKTFVLLPSLGQVQQKIHRLSPACGNGKVEIVGPPSAG